MDKIFNPLIKGTFLLSLIIIFLKTLLLDDIDEIWSKGSEVGKIIYDLCLAYCGGYIFYWVATYEGMRKQKQKIFYLHRVDLKNLVYRLEDIIVFFIHITGKSSVVTHTGQITINIVNSVNDRIIVDSDAVIDNTIGKMTVGEDGSVIFSGGRQYFDELIVKCENMESIVGYIWRSIDHLPEPIIKLLDEVRNNKLKMLINQEIHIQTFIRNKHLDATEITESIHNHIFLQATKLIGTYIQLKNQIESKYNIKLEDREIVIIKGELGLSHDSIDKSSQSIGV